MEADEVLFRAAELMEQRALRATPGPWRAQRFQDMIWINADPDAVTMDMGGSFALDPENPESGRYDAEYICSFDPAMGAIIADVLRREAAVAAEMRDRGRSYREDARSIAPMTIALAYLQGVVSVDLSDPWITIEYEDFDVVMLAGGDVLRVHGALKCFGERCVIHNPSEHPLRDRPLVWRSDKRPPFFERLCEHGIGHPDPDSLDYLRSRTSDLSIGIHGCDGCCATPLEAA